MSGQNATQTASGCKGGLQPIRIRIPGWDGPTERKAVGVAMWYDRHRREWVLYPVDEEGNQLAEARYGFSKAEAMSIKADIEIEVDAGKVY